MNIIEVPNCKYLAEPSRGDAKKIYDTEHTQESVFTLKPGKRRKKSVLIRLSPARRKYHIIDIMKAT